jgi:probable phosphoglycerate mutase
VVFFYFAPQNSGKLSSKKIYLIRHGQTDFNAQGIVQGSGIDSSLNAHGLAQAAAFYDHYKDTLFDRVYTSALRRTHETVRPFTENGIPVEKLTGLNEISWGNKEGTKIVTEGDTYYYHMLSQWQLGDTSLRIEGGESPDDVAVRMRPAIDTILSRTDETRVLVCMHGRAMRILLCMLLNYPLKSMDMFEHENLCLYLVDYNGSFTTVDRYNDTRHLRRI